MRTPTDYWFTDLNMAQLAYLSKNKLAEGTSGTAMPQSGEDDVFAGLKNLFHEDGTRLVSMISRVSRNARESSFYIVTNKPGQTAFDHLQYPERLIESNNPSTIRFEFELTSTGHLFIEYYDFMAKRRLALPNEKSQTAMMLNGFGYNSRMERVLLERASKESDPDFWTVAYHQNRQMNRKLEKSYAEAYYIAHVTAAYNHDFDDIIAVCLSDASLDDKINYFDSDEPNAFSKDEVSMSLTKELFPLADVFLK